MKRSAATRKGLKPAAFVLSTIVLFVGCREENLPKSSWIDIDPSQFDEMAAFEDVSLLVDLGPREAGTKGAEHAAKHIVKRFQQAGLEVQIETFEDPSPLLSVPFRNVIGKLRGGGQGRILIGSHYDTKSGIGDHHVGANDSGSSTGVLIELARTVKASGYEFQGGPDIWFVAFDAEECVVQYGPEDGLHGSRNLARRLLDDGLVKDTWAVIVLDMVGDKDLRITIPRNCDPSLISLAFAAARADGVRSRFSLHNQSILDDHVPFLHAGIPAIDLIDFEYGSRPGKNDYWHTPEDTLDKLDAQSLGVVGRVTIRMINDLARSRIDRTDIPYSSSR